MTNLPDQPWKIARMNKFTYALALGAGLVLSLASPNAQADPIVQSLTTADLSASQFSSLFTPTPGVAALTQNYSFENTGTAGSVESQVFTGTGAATGLYAYAYQFTVNKATDVTTGEPTSVNSTSMLFNATPVVTNFTGSNAAAYVVTNGAIGSLAAPVAAAGSGIQTPSTIAWQPGMSTGSLTFQYLNPTTGTGPLAAGATSGTIVMISTQPFSQQNVFVSLQNPEPQNGYPVVWSPSAGAIDQVPAPEPATVLAWASVLAALAIGHRFRRNHRPMLV
jgi:hypothetical protein